MGYIFEDYQCTLDNLTCLVQLYHNGLDDVYRLIALELRRLLCDVRVDHDLSLLPKANPEIRLQPLFWSKFAAQNQDIIDSSTWLLPGQLIEKENGRETIELLFDLGSEPLTVEKWVQQPFIDLEITIEKFLNYVAYFESPCPADVDGPFLVYCRSLIFKDPESRKKLTLAIAEYILTAAGAKAVPTQSM